MDKAIREWNSKKRRMGCVAAADWFCSRVKGFYPTYRIDGMDISNDNLSPILKNMLISKGIWGLGIMGIQRSSWVVAD